MKKNIIKISVIGIIILGVIGVGTYFTMNKEESTAPDVVVEETIETEWIVPQAKEASKPEVLEPEVEVIEEETVEAIDVVENTEEKPKRKVSVKDVKKFLRERNSFDTVEVSAESVDKVEEVAEVESITIETVNTNQAVETTVSSVDANFASSANLQAIKASADAQIHAECGGGNEHTGFILTPDTAYISYFGAIADNICTVRMNSDTVSLTINAELNDLAWNCMSAALSEVFPNGATLAAACRKDCENGTGGYGAENQWVVIDGVATTVDVLAPEDAGAANLGSIIYTFRR